jgi:uncharacterized membrane protein
VKLDESPDAAQRSWQAVTALATLLLGLWWLVSR